MRLPHPMRLSTAARLGPRTTAAAFGSRGVLAEARATRSNVGPGGVTAAVRGVVTLDDEPGVPALELHALRRTTVASITVSGLVTASLLVTFRVLLHPVHSDGCTTSLLAPPFKTALVPAHLAAAAALSVCVWMLSARHRADGRPTRASDARPPHRRGAAIAAAHADPLAAACVRNPGTALGRVSHRAACPPHPRLAERREFLLLLALPRGTRGRPCAARAVASRGGCCIKGVRPGGLRRCRHAGELHRV